MSHVHNAVLVSVLTLAAGGCVGAGAACPRARARGRQHPCKGSQGLRAHGPSRALEHCQGDARGHMGRGGKGGVACGERAAAGTHISVVLHGHAAYLRFVAAAAPSARAGLMAAGSRGAPESVVLECCAAAGATRLWVDALLLHGGRG
mmetsp:Transcript_27114/g.68942  ORF Transcript_27114/g.68942 Transcript_27114/m.68942 type:complete len:148 (-) Transcript_27114:559-1002(-)